MFLATNLFRKNPKINTNIVPVITGVNKKSNDAELEIIIIGLPPAGGCVTSKKIMIAIPKPTARGIIIKIGKEMYLKNIIPVKEVKIWPKKMFFGLAKGLSGYPKSKTIVDPKDASKKIPIFVSYVRKESRPMVIIVKINA